MACVFSLPNNYLTYFIGTNGSDKDKTHCHAFALQQFAMVSAREKVGRQWCAFLQNRYHNGAEAADYELDFTAQ
jgi:hypothetical protein